MKVLAFNYSPKMDKGNTALILNPFLEVIREAGVEVELFYIRKLKINPCWGGFTCYLKTPGECWQKDDMQMLYPKLCQADIIVFGTPVYAGWFPAPMKNLFDRINGLYEPFLKLYDGHCSLDLHHREPSLAKLCWSPDVGSGRWITST